jgi:hypothetical protein
MDRRIRTATAARLPAVVAVLALAALARVLYGEPHAGYDAWFALSWGRELAGGRLPTLDATIAPTPHPLANAASAIATVFGTHAPGAMALLSLASFAAVGVAAYVLGRRLYGALVGVLFAAILLTRSSLTGQLLYCSIDVPFLALALIAGAAGVGPRPRPALVLAALALAGLLRPEGWVLAGAYVLYAAHRRLLPRRWLVLALLGPPALWAGLDLASTGDALHSLHGTRELSDRLGRPQSISTAVALVPDVLRTELGAPIAFAGCAGALVSLWLAPARVVLALATLAGGLVVFLALGIAGLPLLPRYALLPSVALALCCALALGGWRPGRDRPASARAGLAASAAVAAIAVAISAPADVRTIDAQGAFAAGRLAAEEGLANVVADARTQAVIRRCGHVQAPHAQPVPQLGYLLDVPLAAVTIPAGAIERGVAFDPAPGSPGANLRLGGGRYTFSADETAGTRLVAYNATWAVRARC